MAVFVLKRDVKLDPTNLTWKVADNTGVLVLVETYSCMCRRHRLSWRSLGWQVLSMVWCCLWWRVSYWWRCSPDILFSWSSPLSLCWVWLTGLLDMIHQFDTVGWVTGGFLHVKSCSINSKG